MAGKVVPMKKSAVPGVRLTVSKSVRKGDTLHLHGGPYKVLAIVQETVSYKLVTAEVVPSQQ